MFRYVAVSIRNKIIAVILIAVVSAVLISSITAALRQADRSFSAKQNEIEAIAAAIATTIAEPVKTGNRHQIAATLNAIARIPDVTSAAAYTPSGALLMQFGDGIILQSGSSTAKPGERIGPFSALQLSTFAVEAPIIRDGLPVGRLTLIADISPLRDALFESLLMSLAFGGLAAAIGIAAALFLQRTITTPIVALTRTMQEVRNTNDFERLAERQSRDETGLMVDTFNDMLSHIRKRDQALKQHRDQLEATVDSRTRDLREAVALAQKANAAKSDFLATMSHEIRTPMNGMLVMAELLSASELTPRLQRYADVIVKSGHGLLAIINDILDFSKIEAGKLELESIPVEPRRLVDDTLQLFSERATSAGLEVAAYVDPAVPQQIVADPVRLGQVLTNLVNNALKFTESGGVMVRIDTVELPSMDATTARLRFSVRDTGIGIAKDKIATIFDAFAQADQSTTRKFGGTGIGLSICKRLIDAMGGELLVESEVGEGSTFSFIVPFEVFAAAPEIQPIAAPRRVAIMLPDGLTTEALTGAVRDWGFTIVSDAHDADVIFGDVAALSDGVPVASLDEMSSPVVALGQFGDTRGDKLVEIGRVTRLLDKPLAVTELQSVLETAARDPAQLANVARTRKAAQQRASFEGAHVLAADDSPVNREVLSEVLRRLNVEVTFVEDGAQAVQAVKAGQFDVIFMDGSMPVLDGFEASRQIRDWEDELQIDRVPIVALTAHVAGDKGAQWREAGMSDFVSKPFTIGDIEACLKRWLAEAPPEEVEAGSTEPEKPQDAYAPEAELLNPDVLDVLRDLQSPGDDLVSRVITLYLEHAPPALERVRQLYGENGADCLEVADAAHALKSLSRNIGAVRVGNIADEIEEAARGEGKLPTADTMDRLAAALSQTLASLRHMEEVVTAA